MKIFLNTFLKADFFAISTLTVASRKHAKGSILGSLYSLFVVGYLIYLIIFQVIKVVNLEQSTLSINQRKEITTDGLQNAIYDNVSSSTIFEIVQNNEQVKINEQAFVIKNENIIAQLPNSTNNTSSDEIFRYFDYHIFKSQ